MAEANRIKRVRREFVPAQCPLTAGEQSAEVLLDFVSRRLEPEAAAVFQKHVDLCPACQAFVGTQSAVWQALDAFEAMPVSEDFDRKLWARIEREEREPWWKRISGFDAIWKPAIAVAAMALVMLGLWMRPAPPPAGTASHAEMNLDVEQIDRTLEDMEMLRELGLVAEAGSARQM